jgi:hypothetical protein
MKPHERMGHEADSCNLFSLIQGNHTKGWEMRLILAVVKYPFSLIQGNHTKGWEMRLIQAVVKYCGEAF